MSEYIKREDVKRLINNNFSGLLAAIDSIPAADVAEVVHGRWLKEKKQTFLPVEYDDVGEPILHNYVVYRCDRCGRTCNKKEPYCHCGAEMSEVK